MRSLTIADASALVAAVDRSDPNHDACSRALSGTDRALIVPALVVTEAAYLISRDMGPEVEAAFVESLHAVHVEAPAPDDWTRIAELVRTYADWPLGTVDASIVALAERLGVRRVVTLDERHFRALRPRHISAFDVLPEGRT